MSRTLQFSSVFTADKIDPVNAVIRGVSIITSGLIARGHDLEVDKVTLGQMLGCAKARGQVPVKVDHKSGAAAVCGFLSGFRIEGNKLLADWFLLQSHPQTAQILEVAQRMPRGVGLSASFVSPDNAEPGKARCSELISVDYVTLPAANPDGMFSVRDAKRERLTPLDKIRRAVKVAGEGFSAGAALGVAANGLAPRRRYVRHLPASAALAGGLIAGAAQIRHDRDLSARVVETLFGNRDRPEYLKIRDSIGRNVRIVLPGEQTVETVRTVAKKPLLRRVAVRAAKIAGGAGLGYYAGRKIGARAGAVTGAIAGAFLSSNERIQSMNTHIAGIENAIVRHTGKFPAHGFESHSFDSLSRRVAASPQVVRGLLAHGVLRSRGPVYRGDESGLHGFRSDDLNAVRFSVLAAVAERAVELSPSPEQAVRSAEMALQKHTKDFVTKPSTKHELSRFPKGLVQLSRYDEEEPGLLRRTASAVGKVAAAGAVGYGAASYLRGRALTPKGSLLDRLKAGHVANRATLSEGAKRVATVVGNLRRR